MWEGQGETIVVSRRRDGGVSGFHNVCQHRGARIVPEARAGRAGVHLPLAQLELRPRGHRRRRAGPRGLRRAGSSTGCARRAVECAEWGGWVWAVLAGPGVAPPLADWIGPEIVADLGAYRMEDMVLHDKLVWELDGQLEGRHRRLQRELPRGAPAHDLAAGRQGRPVQHATSCSAATG